jgi:hypothetical protein
MFRVARPLSVLMALALVVSLLAGCDEKKTSPPAPTIPMP